MRVEVAEQQHVGVAARRGNHARGDPRVHALRLRGAACGEAALAVVRIDVAAGRIVAALGLEVVRDHAEALAECRVGRIGDIEHLRGRRAAVHGIEVDQRRADRCEHAAAVDDRDADRIGAERAAGVGIDVRMRAAAARVDRGEQVVDRIARGRVLEFAESDHVGAEAAQHRRDAVALAHEFECAVGAAAIHRARRAAGSAVGARRGVDRREPVQQVHARGLDRAADRGRRRRARIGDRERDRVRFGRTDAPGVGAAQARERPVQHAGQRDDLVAAAEEIEALRAGRETAVRARMPHGLVAVGGRQRPVLHVVAVIEDHAPARELVEVRGVARGRRHVVRGVLARAAAFVQLDLAVAREFEVLADRERVGIGDEHALACFVIRVDRAEHGQVHGGGRDLGEVVARVDDADRGERGRVDLRHVEEFADRAGDAHALAFRDRHRAARAEHEHAFGCRGVGVGVVLFLLQEEARQAAIALEARADDALERDRRADDRRGRAIALHVVDAIEVVVEDRAGRLRVVDDHAADHVADVDAEGLVGLGHSVAIDAHIEHVGRHAGRDDLAGQCTRDVVARRIRTEVRRRDVETDAGRRGRGQLDDERERRGAGIAFDARDVGDRQRRRRVVVDDRAGRLRIGHGRAADVGHVDEQRFVRLGQRVAVHGDREQDRVAACGDHGARHGAGEVIGGRGRGVVGGRDVEADATRGRRHRQRDDEVQRGGARIAFDHGRVRDGQCGQRRAAVRRDRELVDREAMVAAGVIGVGPSQQDLRTHRYRQAIDRETARDAVGGEVAVERTCGAARDGTGEVQRRHGGARSLEIGERACNRRRAEKVRERNRLRGGRAVAPLLAHVGHIERRDRLARVVVQPRAPEQMANRGIARAERPERALGRGSAAVAVEVAAVARAVVGNDREARARARVIPAGDRRVVGPCRGTARGQAVEALLIRVVGHIQEHLRGCRHGDAEQQERGACMEARARQRTWCGNPSDRRTTDLERHRGNPLVMAASTDAARQSTVNDRHFRGRFRPPQRPADRETGAQIGVPARPDHDSASSVEAARMRRNPHPPRRSATRGAIFRVFCASPLRASAKKRIRLATRRLQDRRATPKGEQNIMATSKKPAAGKKSASKPITEALGKSGLVAYLSEHSGVEPKGVRAVLASLEQAVANSVNKKGAGQFTLPGLLKISAVAVAAKPKRKGIDPFTKEERWFAAKPATVKLKVRALKKLKDAAL